MKFCPGIVSRMGDDNSTRLHARGTRALQLYIDCPFGRWRSDWSLVGTEVDSALQNARWRADCQADGHVFGPLPVEINGHHERRLHEAMFALGGEEPPLE